MVSFIKQKNHRLSIIYIILLFTLLTLIDVGFTFVMNTYFPSLFTWFYDSPVFLKVLLLLLTAAVIIKFVHSTLTLIAAKVQVFMSKNFPVNKFTHAFSLLLVWSSAIYTSVMLWKLPVQYDLLNIMALIILTYLIFVINFLFIRNQQAG